jgi:phenylalanyl-tRNA synthetase beta chain
MSLTHEDIMGSFDRLDFKVEVKNDEYIVTIPNRRMDVAIREDLIEEVGRLYGYDNIKGKLPISPIERGSYSSKTLFRKTISKRMRALGLNEVRSYTLISPEESKMFKANNNEDITLLLPMSSDKSVIRQTVIPSLLKIVDYNLARSVKNINIYEISNVYHKKDNEYIEEAKLAFAMLGNYMNNEWQGNIIRTDFYVAKGIIENLFNYLGLNNRYKIAKGSEIPCDMHPGISAVISVDNEVIGYFGAIHPNVSKLPIYVGEISLDKLYTKKTSSIKYKESPKFPSISRDMAFIIDKKVEAASIINVIRKAGGKILNNIDVFDVYVGDKIENDKKSIAFALTFQDENKTLTDDEVNAVFNNIIKEVENKLGAILRNK